MRTSEYDDIDLIAWSPNEQFLAPADGDNVEIWTIDGKKVLSYSGHKGPILNCLWISEGKQRYSDSSMPTTYNFTGQRLDSQTGLLYYGFRYYDMVENFSLICLGIWRQCRLK